MVTNLAPRSAPAVTITPPRPDSSANTPPPVGPTAQGVKGVFDAIPTGDGSSRPGRGSGHQHSFLNLATEPRYLVRSPVTIGN